MLDTNSKTDQKETDDESFRVEKEDERKMSSNMIQDTDQLEENMEDVGLHGKTDNLLKSDVSLEDDTIKTTENW